MPLKGAKAHIRRLQALPALAEREVSKALFAAGELVQTAAQRSITAGSVSGKGHVPSAPGEPPNNDTGVLANNIETTQPSKLRVRVTSDAPYSAALEFGTSRMSARPFMRPARDKTKAEVKRMVEAAMNRAVKKSRRSD
jgi:HK97 gp10 family phage protein